MLLCFKVLVNLAIHFDVLHSSVENDQNFGVDCPVIQVGDVALKNELQAGQR